MEKVYVFHENEPFKLLSTISLGYVYQTRNFFLFCLTSESILGRAVNEYNDFESNIQYPNQQAGENRYFSLNE